MPSAKIVKRFEIVGKKIVFRYPRANDLKGLLELVNAIVDDKAMVSSQAKKTKKEERMWLLSILKNTKKKEGVYLIVEMSGKIVGNAAVERHKESAKKHVGVFGIMLRKEARGKGIGEKLLRCVIEEAKKVLKVKIVTLEVMKSNKVALHLYRKCGFKVIGTIKSGVKYYNRYEDDILMKLSVAEVRD